MSPAEPPGAPGTRFQAEIREQPAALRPSASSGAAFTVPVPTPRPAHLSPLLSVVPGSSSAALSQARGLDSDAPHGLAKVTLAR